jgi:hypothetical protein
VANANSDARVAANKAGFDLGWIDPLYEDDLTAQYAVQSAVAPTGKVAQVRAEVNAIAESISYRRAQHTSPSIDPLANRSANIG